MAGGVKNITCNESYKTTPLPSFLREIVSGRPGGVHQTTGVRSEGMNYKIPVSAAMASAGR